MEIGNGYSRQCITIDLCLHSVRVCPLWLPRGDSSDVGTRHISSGISWFSIRSRWMNKFRAWFEDTQVWFSISQSQTGFLDCNTITHVAQMHLKDLGCDPLFSEVEWEIV